MARLIGNNVILGNSGLNRKYMDDYLGAAQRSGDVLKGVGETVTAAEDSIADYLDRKKKQEEADYIRKRNAQQDLREIQRLDMEKRRYANEQAKHDAEMAAEKDAADAKAARKAYVESIYENEHDKRYESPEGRAAAQAYIDGDRDAFLKLRDRWTSADAIKANEKAAKDEKEAEGLKKEVHDNLTQEFYSLKLGNLTNEQLKDMDAAKRLAYLEKLSELQKNAIDNGFNDVNSLVQEQILRLQGGLENFNAETRRRQDENEKKGKKKSRAEKLRG